LPHQRPRPVSLRRPGCQQCLHRLLRIRRLVSGHQEGGGWRASMASTCAWVYFFPASISGLIRASSRLRGGGTPVVAGRIRTWPPTGAPADSSTRFSFAVQPRSCRPSWRDRTQNQACGRKDSTTRTGRVARFILRPAAADEGQRTRVVRQSFAQDGNLTGSGLVPVALSRPGPINSCSAHEGRRSLSMVRLVAPSAPDTRDCVPESLARLTPGPIKVS